MLKSLENDKRATLTVPVFWVMEYSKKLYPGREPSLLVEGLI
jgi:hypothetical protein